MFNNFLSLMLSATLMTLGLALVSLLIGLMLALLLSAAELSRHLWLRWPVAGPAGCRRRIVRDGHKALSSQSQAYLQAF